MKFNVEVTKYVDKTMYNPPFKIMSHWKACIAANEKQKLAKKKTKYEINFYQFFKIKFLKYKFEGNWFFKLLKNAKKCNFYFSKN